MKVDRVAYCYICGEVHRPAEMVEVFHPIGKGSVWVCPGHLGVKALHQAWVNEMKKVDPARPRP